MDSSTSATSLASLPVRLLPLQLTPSGRPVLLPGEAERLIHDRADLVFVPTPEEEKERDDSSSLRFPRSLEDGVLRVTTHRLLWVDSRAAPSSGSSCSLPLAYVTKAELRATRLWSSAKARVLVGVDGATGRLLLPSSSSSSSTSNSSSLSREIKVVAPGQAAIHAALQASLSAREWEKSGSVVVGGEGGTTTAASPSNRQQQGEEAEVDDAAVAAVVQMGFSAADAVAALRATAGGGGGNGGGDPQDAALWLLERGEEEEKKGKGKGGQTVAAATATAAAAAATATTTTTTAVGVGGLLAREAASAAAADAALESAFADLGALMRAAAEMVALATKYREEARAREERRRRGQGREEEEGGQGGGSSASSGAETEAAAADFDDELALLGVIASPVTRATAGSSEASSAAASSASPSRFSLLGGSRKSANPQQPPPRKGSLSLFIRELSAELLDFCQPLVVAAGGLLPLTDVYCLYNRARGAELAAPLDVVAAAEAWEVLYGSRAPLRLRRLGEGGGVLAVAAADQDDGAVCGLLAALARGGEGEEEAAAAVVTGDKGKALAAASAARARLPPAPSVPGLGRPLTPSDVAAAMRVPLPIAAAHLATAEAAGALCRDDGDEGVRHFWNFFSSKQSAASSTAGAA